QKQQQQKQEWDAWVEEIVIDEDEVIPKDETPKLITKHQDVDKRVPIIFDYERMKATLNDALSNQFKNPKEYAYHLEQTMNFMENQILGIESYQIKVNLTAPTLTFPGIEAHEPYSIVDKLSTGLIYLNNNDEKRVMYLTDIVKFCDATLEKVFTRHSGVVVCGGLGLLQPFRARGASSNGGDGRGGVDGSEMVVTM
ncbi:hypothetical protein Tco_0983645, partial [Tanacetum coccineum]